MSARIYRPCHCGCGNILITEKDKDRDILERYFYPTHPKQTKRVRVIFDVFLVRWIFHGDRVVCIGDDWWNGGYEAYSIDEARQVLRTLGYIRD